MNRLTEAIAEGVLLKAEARDTMAELRETKGRLERELLAIAEKEATREDYRRAVKALQSANLEAELWDMLKNSPLSGGKKPVGLVGKSNVILKNYLYES